MRPHDTLHELRFLVGLLHRERRKPRRGIIIDDFAARATARTPSKTVFVDLLTKGAMSLTGREAASLLEQYIELPQTIDDGNPVDVLIVCVKPVERTAVLTVLGRPKDAGRAGDVQGADGREYFLGTIDSKVAGRKLTYRVVALNEQGNRRTAIEMAHILGECAPSLAVLIGMAAGPTSQTAGDVVASEVVLDAGPGTRTDTGRVRAPDQLIPEVVIRHQVQANQPELNGWHQRLADAAARAEEAGIDLPARGRPAPEYTSGAIVSDEEKDETTTLDDWLQAHSGDAKAYDMESAGFGSACQRHTKTLDWMVFRGIADFGALPVDGGVPQRPKEMQMWATLSAASCFLTWMTQQTSYFGTDGER